MILFLCTHGNAHVLTWARDREDAKIKARQWLWRNPDQYTVTPLTTEGDRVHISVTLNA